MVEFILESATDLPKLSQTSLFMQFNEQSQIGQKIKETISDKEFYVQPDALKEITSLIRLNGSSTAKSAIDAFNEGRLKIIFNKDRSKIPTALPYIVIKDSKGTVTPYVFADRVVSNVASATEYPNLMATVEAAYLAAALQAKPNQILLNRQLVLNLCELYLYMWLMPLEQKLYMKGDNLTKAEIYIITYFYQMIDGEKATYDNIPFKRLIKDRVANGVLQQLVTEVKTMPSMAIDNLIKLIKALNPVRYKELEATFMSYFTNACGVTLVFALENPQYLFLLLTSSYYKTKVTAFGLNKISIDCARTCEKTLNTLGIEF